MSVTTHIAAVCEHVGAALVVLDPDVEVDLGHGDGVRGGARQVETLVALAVTLGGVHHVVT